MQICLYSHTYKLSRSGRGALAHVGDSWYPVRLIQYKEAERTWLVRWWRGCFIEPLGSTVPGSITAISESDVVDSLWGDRMGRRKVRVCYSFLLDTRTG